MKEAGDFPVIMEEVKLLQQEVVARRWVSKARRVVESKPRVDSLEHLLRELKDLRSQFPIAERTEIWGRLREENDIRRVIRNAEKWLSQAHLAESRRLPIRRVKALLDSTDVDGVNVDTEVGGLLLLLLGMVAALIACDVTVVCCWSFSCDVV